MGGSVMKCAAVQMPQSLVTNKILLCAPILLQLVRTPNLKVYLMEHVLAPKRLRKHTIFARVQEQGSALRMSSMLVALVELDVCMMTTLSGVLIWHNFLAYCIP